MQNPHNPLQKDYFISYNKADRLWAEWIAWELEEAGYSTVLQAWDFRPGSNFVLEMDEATKDAHRTIAILSPDYLKALYTKPEWAAAFAQDPTGKDRKLIPIRVREGELSGLLAQIVYIDLVGVNETAARYNLLAGIKSGRAKPSTPPGFPATGTSSTPSAGGVHQTLPAQPVFPQNLAPLSKAIEIFIAYAHEDEKLRNELEKRLVTMHRQGLITAWYDSQIVAGSNRKQEINKHLNNAGIILLLVSPDYIASDECYEIEKHAMERYNAGEARVIPIILNYAEWEEASFSDLEILPSNRIPVTGWPNQSQAFLDIVKGIRKAVDELST
jgi:hypothetical protein